MVSVIQWCDVGLIGPRNTTVDAHGRWAVIMRGVTDCLSANPYHRAGWCRFPYSFRATLHVAGGAAATTTKQQQQVEISGINFKRGASMPPSPPSAL